jgi:hypothetical protein
MRSGPYIAGYQKTLTGDPSNWFVRGATAAARQGRQWPAD